MRNTFNKRFESGMTLVEALVALAILGVALTPAVILASSSLKTAAVIKNNVIASFLAQEGVEVVRALRDSNWFNGQPFDTGLTGCPPPTGCRVEWMTTKTYPPSLLPIAGEPVLNVEAGRGLYQYGAGVPSIFHRRITIESRPPSELIITSEVTWAEGSQAKNVLVEDHLFDWK
jgi:prepilin-type N-terminal cleavage/methylation domain-containing protein